MDCNIICQRIHQAILTYQKENPDLTDTIVVIDIRKPYDSIEMIPRLEHKDTNLAT
jgi:GTP-binding protein EngB required for normal cell division